MADVTTCIKAMSNGYGGYQGSRGILGAESFTAKLGFVGVIIEAKVDSAGLGKRPAGKGAAGGAVLVPCWCF